jgi:Tfp pilus assembly protein PilN
MRPVNLIPPEERRGEKAPMRTGPLAYVIVAVLGVALLGVTLTVLASNHVSDRKAEKASLQAELTQAQAEAHRLQSFTEFATLQQAREQTVTSLAQSRFDWQRVLQELAIVIPHDVWLTNLSAKVSASAQAAGSETSTSSSSSSPEASNVTGPSLDIQGCASGHEAVATFLASLHDVDGVTRVSVLKSDLPDESSSTANTTAAPAGGTSASCAARNFISSFEVVAAFDGAQLGATPESSASTSPSTTPTSSTSGASGTPSSADASQVSDGQQELQQQKDSAARQTDKAHKAVHTLIPGTGTAP